MNRLDQVAKLKRDIFRLRRAVKNSPWMTRAAETLEWKKVELRDLVNTLYKEGII